MYKIISFNLLFLLIFFSFTFSQGTVDDPPPLIERYLEGYQDLGSFDKFQKNGEEEQNFELKAYMATTNILYELDQDIFRLFYANADKRKTMVDHSHKRSYDTIGIEFNIVDYYSTIQYEGTIFLTSAYELLLFLQKKYDEIKEGLPYIQIPEQEVFDVQVKIKTLEGICLFYLTGENNLKRALSRFNFLLGQNPEKVVYANTKIAQERTFKYIIGTYSVLLEKGYNLTTVDRKDYQTRLLYYKWKLVELLNQDNADLKDYKLMRLTKKYYTHMPLKGAIFEEKYKSYVVKLYDLAKDDKALEEKLILKFGENIVSYHNLNKIDKGNEDSSSKPVESTETQEDTLDLEE